jgi:hypothetical protein
MLEIDRLLDQLRFRPATGAEIEAIRREMRFLRDSPKPSALSEQLALQGSQSLGGGVRGDLNIRRTHSHEGYL